MQQPTIEQSNIAIEQAKADFARVLGSWASDLLEYRRCDLLLPTWRIQDLHEPQDWSLDIAA